MMASKLARGIAAQAWCQPLTKSKAMDVELCEAFAEVLEKYIAALRWCSGSADFGPGGQAEVGYAKIRDRLLPLGGVAQAETDSEAVG